MSYTVAGELCDTRLKAIEAHIGQWFAMTSPEELATLDAEEQTDQFIDWYNAEENGRLQAEIVGRRNEFGEPLYEYLEATRDEILTIISNCIEEAKDD